MLQPHSRLCIFLRAHEPSCQQSASEPVVPWCLQDCEQAADLFKVRAEASEEELRGVREEVRDQGMWGHHQVGQGRAVTAWQKVMKQLSAGNKLRDYLDLFRQISSSFPGDLVQAGVQEEVCRNVPDLLRQAVGTFRNQ